jgi:molecular chaperone GrpE
MDAEHDPTREQAGAPAAPAPESADPAPEPQPGPDGESSEGERGRATTVTDGEREGQADEAQPDNGGAADLEQDIAELVARRDEYLALAQRTQADFENYRKRMAREVSAAERRGMAKLARELLPALDNLHLALERTEGHDPGPLADGVRLVLAELVAALARAGIEAYSPEGEPFDPQVHEAVGQRTVDGREAGTVLEVVQQGYRHGETVLRPARVFVAG